MTRDEKRPPSPTALLPMREGDPYEAAREGLRRMGYRAYVSEGPTGWIAASLPGWECPAGEGALDAVSETGHVRCSCGQVWVDREALTQLAALAPIILPAPLERGPMQTPSVFRDLDAFLVAFGTPPDTTDTRSK